MRGHIFQYTLMALMLMKVGMILKAFQQKPFCHIYHNNIQETSPHFIPELLHFHHELWT